VTGERDSKSGDCERREVEGTGEFGTILNFNSKRGGIQKCKVALA